MRWWGGGCQLDKWVGQGICHKRLDDFKSGLSCRIFSSRADLISLSVDQRASARFQTLEVLLCYDIILIGL